MNNQESLRLVTSSFTIMLNSAVILKRETRCESLLCLAQCTSLTINMVEKIIKSTVLKIDKNGFN